MVATLLYSIAGGMLSILATARIEQIAWKFIRFVGFAVLAIASGVTLWSFRSVTGPPDAGMKSMVGLGIVLGVGAIFVVLAAPLAARWTRSFRLIFGLLGIAGIAAASVSAVSNMQAGLDSRPLLRLATPLVILGQFLSALMLGSVTVAWLLGHAYLTATKMTIAPLRHFSRMLSWSVAARILFMLMSLVIAWQVRGDPNSPILQRVGQSWLIVVLRVGVGLATVAVFAYMVADCVRLRSTQSATGILYFGSVMAYVGELAGQQLIVELGWPI
ncbi:MAG: hypothetical protein AAB385_08630 [Planctomycetota bacterium]|mgnify:FL=1